MFLPLPLLPDPKISPEMMIGDKEVHVMARFGGADSVTCSLVLRL